PFESGGNSHSHGREEDRTVMARLGSTAARSIALLFAPLPSFSRRKHSRRKHALPALCDGLQFRKCLWPTWDSGLKPPPEGGRGTLAGVPAIVANRPAMDGMG